MGHAGGRPDTGPAAENQVSHAPGVDVGQAAVTPITDLISEDTTAELFALVLTLGPLSRTHLAQRLNLSPSTVTRLLAPLVEAGYLRESPAEAAGRGRPQRLLQVNTDRHVVVGIKIAPQYVTGVLADLSAQVLAKGERPLPDLTPGTAIDAAAQLVGQLLVDAPRGVDQALGIGVATSGHVDPVHGTCRYSALHGWHDVDIAGLLHAATGLPVAVNNDVNAVTVAEHWFGHGRDVDSFAVVTNGTGVGCGLILGGTLYSGASGMAGEFGHLPMDPAGPECTCGNRGCLEALAASPAVLRALHNSGHTHCSTIEQARTLARTDTGAAGKAARTAFSSAGDALGRGLAGLCNVLNLEKIILAGEGVAAYDLFGPAMSAAFDQHTFSDAARDCTIHVDPVTNDLWARGAACLAIQHSVRASWPNTKTRVLCNQAQKTG